MEEEKEEECIDQLVLRKVLEAFLGALKLALHAAALLGVACLGAWVLTNARPARGVNNWAWRTVLVGQVHERILSEQEIELMLGPRMVHAAPASQNPKRLMPIL